MKDIYQKYLDNLAEGHMLIKKNLFSTADNKDTMLEQIRENSRRAYQLRIENDKILHDILYSRKAEDLTDSDIDELTEFAGTLFAFTYQTDIGTAYRIHQLIMDYAQRRGDRDLIIRQYYNLGNSLFYLNPLMNELGVNLFGREVTAYYQKGADYLSQYEEISNHETQGYILRCLTNLCMADENTTCKHQPCIPTDPIATYPAFQEYYDRMMQIYESPHYRALTPDFPWEKAIYNLQFNRSLFYLDLDENHPGEILQAVIESAEYVYNHTYLLTQFQYSTKAARIEHIYASCQHLAGKITTAELVEKLIDLIQSADPDDFSANGIILNLQFPLYLELTYKDMPEEKRRPYTDTLKAIIHRTHDYLLRAPHNEFSNVVTHAVSDGIRYRAQRNQPLQKRLFNSLLFCHPPTFIHVRMAASLSRKLFLRMVETSPEALRGTFGISDLDELIARREELADRVYTCSLYHDVGKVMLLDYIGIYGRALLDEEFGAIKLHTNIGAALLEKLEPEELSVVALHHHRFYDETSGYPDNCPPCPPQYKAVVDIISVSDSIEAATDDIGRCYSAAKTFPQIVGELRKGSGTRYSPAVIKLFDDEEFFRFIEQSLYDERKDTYFEIYSKPSDAALDTAFLAPSQKRSN